MVEDSVLKEEFLTPNLFPLLRTICLVSWFLLFFFFSFSFSSLTALLLESREDGKGVGWVVKGPEFSCRKRKAKNECVFLPAFKQFILLKKKVLWKWSQTIKREYKLLSLRPALHFHYILSNPFSVLEDKVSSFPAQCFSNCRVIAASMTHG